MTGRRLLYLITDFKVGGAQTQVIEVGGRLRTRGWDVQVVSMVRPVALRRELDEAGLPITDLGMRLGVPDPRGLWRLVRLLRRRRPDVLHSHLVHANLLGRMARPLAAVPALVCTAHNVVEGSPRLEVAYRVTDRWADLTTHVCRAGADRYVRIDAVPAEKVTVVPNGIDTARFRPPDAPRRPDGSFRWLAAGRLEPQKDHATLVRAVRRLVDGGRDASLLIAGAGSLGGDLRRLVGGLELGGRVKLAGARDDLPELLRSVDGFVSSSRWEGLPIAVLEAAASGLPVVATRVGGTPDTIVDGESGCLVGPEDPVSLADAMQRVMDLSYEGREEMGRRGRRRVELHFDLGRIVDRWEEVYGDLLGGADASSVV